MWQYLQKFALGFIRFSEKVRAVLSKITTPLNPAKVKGCHVCYTLTDIQILV